MNITTLAAFNMFVSKAPKVVIADVETKGRVASLDSLLGIALSWADTASNATEPFPSAYVVVNEWSHGKECLLRRSPPELLEAVRKFLRSRELVGHNVEYDREWVDAAFQIKSAWSYDTKIMWHLTDEAQVERGYGLKSAQTTILGWEERGDVELDEIVRLHGGRLKNGDHYLAPATILGRYAALDAKATAQLYSKLLPKLQDFKGINYLPFYRWVHSYNRLLAKATRAGVDVDLELLEDGQRTLTNKSILLRKRIRELCKEEIEKLEREALKEALGEFKTARGKLGLLSNAERLRMTTGFNFNSNDQKAALFYDVLGIPCTELTPTGQRKIDKGTIASFNHPVAKKFVEYAENEKLSQMVAGYQDALSTSPDNKIHFPYNITGTVSGRLGGYKPYALNMPFESEEAMRPFLVPHGYEGIHSDLRSVEPSFIAALSKDPTLLKVHRDGLGDVYLDFALIAFPNHEALRAQYDPNVPVLDAVKAEFKAIRNVCKTVHLAIGYTGTKVTIAKNLTKAGFPTTQDEADVLVKRYWALFSNVYDLNARCKQLAERRGYIVGPFGRVVIVPRGYTKDAMNRLVQSAAHDCLTEWVKEIVRETRKQKLEMRPLLPDCHDSTTHVVREGQYELAEKVFASSLRRVSDRLDLGITLSCETKKFKTLFGLKGNEE